jgi:hypothetical protein
MSGVSASESPIKIGEEKNTVEVKQIAVERSGHDHIESEERKVREKVQEAEKIQMSKSPTPASNDHNEEADDNAPVNVTKDQLVEQSMLEEAKKQEPAWKKQGRKCLDHNVTVIGMTLITFYALFFDDIRMIGFEKSQDDGFFAITLIGMLAFSVEILLAAFCMEDYYLSFFFWLDLVSTVSMIPDCGWIWDPLTGGGSTDATDLAKTSRAGRVTRVIRVIRLIRLIRIVKLYKQAKLAQKKAAESQLSGPGFLKKKTQLEKKKTSTQRIHPIGQPIQREDSFEKELKEIDQLEAAKSGGLGGGADKRGSVSESPRKVDITKKPEEEEDELEIPLESKIGKTLSERTTKIVIILVLVMLFALQLFQIETYVQTDYIHDIGLQQLRNMYEKDNGGSNYQTVLQKYVRETKSLTYPTVYLEIGGDVVFR